MMVPRYKLRISYTIEKVTINPEDVIAGIAPREGFTGERISIDTNMDLNTGSALSQVLLLIDQMNALATKAQGS